MSALLCVRVPCERVADLRRCPGLVGGYFDRVISLGQTADDDVRDWVDDGSAEAIERTKALCTALADACRITHAIICQPLLWYSAAAAEALRSRGVRIFWTEAYFDGRMMLDEVGLQYTADNEIVRYSHLAPIEPAELHTTRHPQPDQVTREEILSRYGADRMVIFGQVPGDMALRDTSGGMDYDGWLAALIECNPKTQFLFKHHPLAKTDLPLYANVQVVDEHVHSLLDAYPLAAAFSSTVILEGMARGVCFATGGHHFMKGLTLRVRSRSEADDIVNRLRKWPATAAAVEQRIAFIERRYAVRFDDERTLARLICDDLTRHYGE